MNNSEEDPFGLRLKERSRERLFANTSIDTISDKRTSMISVTVEDIEKEDVKKMSRKDQNKYYAKLNRRKKKEYTIELEAKIDRLEAEIVDLRDKLKKHQQEWKRFNVKADFEQASEYWKSGLISDLRNSIIDVGNRFKYFSEIVGPASFERQKLIKQAINTIIDNVLPDPMKWMTYLVEQGTNASEKDYNKLFTLPVYSASIELKNPKFGEIDHALFNAGVDGATRNKMLSLSPKIIEFRQSIRVLIHDLVKIRNKLLTLQNGFNIGKLLVNSYISPFSLSKVLEYWNKVDSSKFSRFTLWEITKKSLFVQNDEDSINLTDSEDT